MADKHKNFDDDSPESQDRMRLSAVNDNICSDDHDEHVRQSGNDTGGQILTTEEASAVFMRHVGFIRAIAERNAPSRLLVEDVINDTLVYFLENAAVLR